MRIHALTRMMHTPAAGVGVTVGAAMGTDGSAPQGVVAGLIAALLLREGGACFSPKLWSRAR